MRSLVAGNWKMNGLRSALGEIKRVAEAVAADPPHAEILICPPSTLIAQSVVQAAGRIAIGGQDCHAEPSGAFTGDVSAEMLRDAGAQYVIVGHSERRQFHRETDAEIAAKTVAAWRAGLTAIVCVGETQAERDGARAPDVVAVQLAGSLPQGANAGRVAVAYEPVWAIGTGRTPTASDIVEMHRHIRTELVRRHGDAGRPVRILYGGSVKPANAREILALPEVGGALVGGASLKAADFREIFTAAPAKV